MGHIRLGSLPRTRRWQQVIELLYSDGDVSAIADASLEAAENGLRRAGADFGFIHTLTAIFQFLESASTKDFVGELNRCGYSLPDDASLLEIVSNFKSKVDSELGKLFIKSDASEIAQNAFTEVLVRHASAETGSLFAVSPETVHRTFSKLAAGDRLKGLMHEFFSSFTSRYLSYYLSRELSNHIGHGQRFEDIEAHGEFNKAFDLYVRQAIRITDEFTPGWFGKARFEGDITPESVSKYAHVAFKKIVGEFTRGGEAHQ